MKWLQAGSCAALIAAACLQIIATYTVLSPTNDERANLGAGLEWWHGTYNTDPTNPPLARVLIASWLPGQDIHSEPNATAIERFDVAEMAGDRAIFGADDPLRNLSLARLGVLPIFVLAPVLVYLLSSRALAGLLAVLLYTTLPPVLAHAGLTTSDFAEAAMLTLAVLAFVEWLPNPTPMHSVALGAAVGLALVTKFSALVFLPACFGALLLWFGLIKRRLIVSVLGTLYAGLAMCLVIWAIYRFSIGPILLPGLISAEHQDRYAHLLSSGLIGTLVTMPVPAPEFFRGIAWQYMHNAIGHPGYLWGEIRQTGWWYFFPVVLAVKTPIPTLFLGAIGGSGLLMDSWRKRRWRLAVAPLCCVALLLSVMPSHINIGVRYILPIYGFLAIAAGYGAVMLYRTALWGTVVVVVLCLWQVTSSGAWWPDYLAYFNQAARLANPPVVVDSDLDWGQDLFRLSTALHERGINKVSVALFAFDNKRRHDQLHYAFPETVDLPPNEPTSGWIAISYYVLYEVPGYSWLREHQPVATIGQSILLYHL